MIRELFLLAKDLHSMWEIPRGGVSCRQTRHIERIVSWDALSEPHICGFLPMKCKVYSGALIYSFGYREAAKKKCSCDVQFHRKHFSSSVT